MATAQVLQKPVILGIEGSTIRVAHPKIGGYPTTQVNGGIDAAGTTLNVLDNNGFSDNDWLIIGEVGDNQTESTDVDGAVTRGTSMTVTNYLAFDHEGDAPVTRIQERGIKIYGAATDGGAGTILESIDAITASGRQLVDAFMIQWDKLFTEYTFQSGTDTAYAYYYVTFTDGTTESSASDYIPAAGWDDARVMKLIQSALDLTDTQLDNRHITLDMCVRWADEAQKHITQFKYQDPQTGELKHIDWDFENVLDSSLLASTNQNIYNLSSMTITPKYTDSDRAIVSIRMGDKKKLNKKLIEEMDEILAEKPNTEVKTQATAGSTTLEVDSNVVFSDSGTLYVAGQELTYTGKSGTDTFTGIPASGTGSITATIAVDEPVWQNVTPGLPTRYAVYNGQIILDLPVGSDYDNYPFNIRIYKQLPALTEASDQTEVSFYNVFHSFIAARIEKRKKNPEKAMEYMAEFQNQVLNNALANSVPLVDASSYYNFVDDKESGNIFKCDTNQD